MMILRSIMLSSILLIALLGLQNRLWAQPAIEFETQQFDFGVAYPNNKLVHHFVYKNIGTDPLVIYDVSTTCGCTAAVLSATTIPASATGIISVTMTTSVPGKMHKTATVFTNDPAKSQQNLDIIAQVRNIWQWTPKSTFSFSNVPFQSKDEMEFTLTNIEGEPFDIVGYKISRPEFTVEHQKVAENIAKIKVTFESGTVKESVTDLLEIRTDNPNQPVVNITLSGQVVGNIAFDRKSLYFSMVKTGETVSREMVANYLGNDLTDFQIGKISDPAGLVEGKVIGKTDDGGFRIAFTIKAPAKTGYLNGEVHIETNAPSEKLFVLPYSALVRSK